MAQELGGEQGGGERGDQDGGFDVLADLEGKFTDESGDGEPDAGRRRQAKDVAPGQVGVEPGTDEAGGQLGAGEIPTILPATSPTITPRGPG